MIYIDSSVALAQLLFEPRSPPAQFWREELVSSRLLEYEIWNRVHAYDPAGSNIDPARTLLMGVELLELDRVVLARFGTVADADSDARRPASRHCRLSAPTRRTGRVGQL